MLSGLFLKGNPTFHTQLSMIFIVALNHIIPFAKASDNLHLNDTLICINTVTCISLGQGRQSQKGQNLSVHMQAHLLQFYK